MSDLIRDSVFGQLVRLATGGKVFQYPDETDPSIRERYINKEKSANLARYGTAEAPAEGDGTSSPSSSTSEDLKEDLEKDKETTPEQPPPHLPSCIQDTDR